MDLGEATRIWRKHWIVTSVLLLVAFGGTFEAALKLPRTYQAQSYVTLLASQQSSQQSGGNPYLNFSPSLDATADALVYELMDPRTVQLLGSKGYTSSYTVVYNQNSPAPILQATVTSTNEAEAGQTLRGITNETSTLLKEMQTGTAVDKQIRVVALSATQPKISKSKTARMIVLIAAVMILLALFIPIITDSGRRTAHRNDKREMGAHHYRSEGQMTDNTGRQVGYATGNEPELNDRLHLAPGQSRALYE